jgi:RNA polymerase sigma factor (sigma-70 family)
MNFETFYQQSYKVVYKYFYYRIYDKSLVDDLTQDVYVRFYKKYFTDSDCISAENVTEHMKLVYGFCRNIYKEHIYKSLKTPSIQFNDEIDYGLLNTLTEKSINEVEVTRLKRILKEAISKLNPTVRRVIELRFLHSMTRKEVANILEVSEDDVHTYQKRGIKYIKNLVTNPNLEPK